jgi:ureidoglycolate lyase
LGWRSIRIVLHFTGLEPQLNSALKSLRKDRRGWILYFDLVSGWEIEGQTYPVHAIMHVKINTPQRELILEVQALRQDLFSKFGTVIENPAPSLVPSQAYDAPLPPNAVQANQGSALKYLDVTHMKDLYIHASSKQPSKAVMNMFVCAPRRLLLSPSAQVEGLFPVEILERHPFTTQTFIPLGLSKSEASESRYLVIVAPSLTPSLEDEHFPVPSASASGDPLPGRGLPDLMRIKAFVASGSQAVTYAAGTW